MNQCHVIDKVAIFEVGCFFINNTLANLVLFATGIINRLFINLVLRDTKLLPPLLVKGIFSVEFYGPQKSLLMEYSFHLSSHHRAVVSFCMMAVYISSQLAL